MPTWKLDLVFEANGRGWEETYYRVWPGPGFASVVTVATNLAQKRIALSASPVVIKAYRITDPLTEGVQGQSVYFNPNITPPNSPQDVGASDPSTSINVSYRVDTGETGRRIALRGVWDSAIQFFGKLDGGSYAAWFAKFQQYATYVTQQNFGWMRSVRAGSRMQVSYAYATGSAVPTFTFVGNFFDLAQVGTYQNVRFSKFNTSRSPLNRELVVYVNSQTTAVAATAIAAGPMINPGTAIRYGTPIFTAADAVVVDRVGRRSPGAPLLDTPGRRRARARS